jgi:hypothetical protein
MTIHCMIDLETLGTTPDSARVRPSQPNDSSTLRHGATVAGHPSSVTIFWDISRALQLRGVGSLGASVGKLTASDAGPRFINQHGR